MTIKPRQLEHCIFCRRRGNITGEHVWAGWLRPHLPKMTSFSSMEATRSDFNRRIRVGDIQNRKLRIVCGQCNSGWMSDLQQRAKPLLLSLIQGEATALDAEAQKIVAGWIAMTITVAEYFGKNITITLADRRHIRRTQTPPPLWKIWIAHFARGNWKAHLIQRCPAPYSLGRANH